MTKYIIHPGYVESKNDGDMHYISYSQLIRLYNVNPKHCVKANRAVYVKRKDEVHLYPNYRGDYDLSNL